MPATVTCCSTSHARSCSTPPVVVANVLICCRRPPRGPGTRTHAFTSALPTSRPAHRSIRTSTGPRSFPPLSGGGPGGAQRDQDVESRARSNNHGYLSCAAASGYESGSKHQCGTTSPARRHTDFHPARAARTGHDRLRGEAQLDRELTDEDGEGYGIHTPP